MLRLSQRPQGNGTARRRIAHQNTPQISRLAKMKACVRAEVHEERARAERHAHHLLGELALKSVVGKLRQHTTNHGDCGVELGVDVFAWTGPLPEFELASTNVSGSAEHLANEVLKVACDVQREVAGG